MHLQDVWRGRQAGLADAGEDPVIVAGRGIAMMLDLQPLQCRRPQLRDSTLAGQKRLLRCVLISRPHSQLIIPGATSTAAVDMLAHYI